MTNSHKSQSEKLATGGEETRDGINSGPEAGLGEQEATVASTQILNCKLASNPRERSCGRGGSRRHRARRRALLAGRLRGAMASRGPSASKDGVGVETDPQRLRSDSLDTQVLQAYEGRDTSSVPIVPTEKEIQDYTRMLNQPGEIQPHGFFMLLRENENGTRTVRACSENVTEIFGRPASEAGYPLDLNLLATSS